MTYSQPPAWYGPPEAIHLPTTPTSYPMFWRTPGGKMWRIVVLMVLGVFASVALTFFFLIPAIIVDRSIIGPGGQVNMTPALFLANNLSLAALIPVGMGLAWWLTSQRPGYLSSVVGRLRWPWLWTCVLATVPIWTLSTGLTLWLGWSELSLKIYPHTVSLIVIVLTTQAFQAAGEEYAFRGVLFRGIASLVPIEWLGVVLGAIIPSGIFMVLHDSTDIWLNTNYVVFAACASWLTWRTGGLEAAIAMHAVNNVFSLGVAPFQPLSGIFDREAGVGSPWMLVDMAILVAATALLAWLARRTGIQSHNDPGKAQASISPPGFVPLPGGLPPMQPQTEWNVPPGYQPPPPRPYDGAP